MNAGKKDKAWTKRMPVPHRIFRSFYLFIHFLLFLFTFHYELIHISICRKVQNVTKNLRLESRVHISTSHSNTYIGINYSVSIITNEHFHVFFSPVQFFESLNWRKMGLVDCRLAFLLFYYFSISCGSKFYLNYANVYIHMLRKPDCSIIFRFFPFFIYRSQTSSSVWIDLGGCWFYLLSYNSFFFFFCHLIFWFSSDSHHRLEN